MRHQFPGEDPLVPKKLTVLNEGDPEVKMYKTGPWQALKVVLCTAIVFAFFAYLAYLGDGRH